MKISELIIEAAKAFAAYGDLEVAYEDPGTQELKLIAPSVLIVQDSAAIDGIDDVKVGDKVFTL